jgi:hypothetical protein
MCAAWTSPDHPTVSRTGDIEWEQELAIWLTSARLLGLRPAEVSHLAPWPSERTETLVCPERLWRRVAAPWRWSPRTGTTTAASSRAGGLVRAQTGAAAASTELVGL